MFKKLTTGVRAYKLWSRSWDLVQRMLSEWRIFKRQKEQAMADTANGVPIKPAHKSKINAKEVASLLIAIAALFGFKFSEQDQATILAAVLGVSAAVGIILRTWYNNSVTRPPSEGE